MTPIEFKYFSEFLKAKSGIVLAADKSYLVESRLAPIANRTGHDSVADMINAIRRTPSGPLAEDAVEAMTTNETFFFRDNTPFENLKTEVLPKMLEARKSSRKLRIWCAAASTGQEPYSIAMCLLEMKAQFAGWKFEIIGTDLSMEALNKARAGKYTQFEVQRGLPINLLLKYFKQEGDAWQINDELRQMVSYKPINLLNSFNGLGTFDVIFCRNVLIYFDPKTKKDILDRAAKLLPADGYLALGAAETVVGICDEFKPVAEKRGLYEKQIPGAQSTNRFNRAFG
ncbi:MAG: protein-glutamate O-methyltransferase CheR [Rhizobiales bacterium]|nr:protein-glutamate O-methyltransferase CheR [Hyphomicrobiales bacterium]